MRAANLLREADQ